MPESVLDGKLGDLCAGYLSRYPRANAWPALVTTASCLVPRQSEKQKFNFYTALVGPVGSGKTVTERAAQELLQIGHPELPDAMVGSGEGLMQRISDASGNPRHFVQKTKVGDGPLCIVLLRS